jgi:excisionase family DNA binding protein
MERPRSPIEDAPTLITPDDAAELLNVSPSTIRSWIEKGRIPYVQLPGSSRRARYRIPLEPLLRSLSGNYDLAAALGLDDGN